MAIFTGTGGPDTLPGGAAGDLLLGLGGGDQLFGGAGPDTILGGRGNDEIDGDLRQLPPLLPPAGEGNLILAGPGEDLVRGGIGADTILGDGGDDELYGGIGGSFDGFTEGGFAANYGQDAGDIVDGGAGDDRVDGAGGNDTLLGGTGRDTLVGGAGADLLWGGPGADTFAFGRSFAGFLGGPDSSVGPGQRDVILDFHSGQDLLDLRRLDVPSGGVGGPVADPVFLDTGPFIASSALQVRVTTVGDHVVLQIASAQAGPPGVPAAPDGEIELIGVHHVQASDILLA